MDVNLPLDPPVNNSLQATLYDKIDAVTFERIRVANSQLNSRLEIQEKILNKYRKEAARIHDNQYKKIHKEFRKIHNKKPDYADDFDYGRTRHDSESKFSKQRSLSEPSDCSSYCRRYYSHHYHIKDPAKVIEEEEIRRKPVKDDYFNARLRCFFLNMVNYATNNSSYSPTLLQHDEKVLSGHGSIDDDGNDLLQESTNTLQDLEEEEVFENPDAPNQTKILKSNQRSVANDTIFSDIPVRGPVVNALRLGLENVCNNSGDTKRSTAGIRLEAILPRHRKPKSDKRLKDKKRSSLPVETNREMLSKSFDSAMLKTGGLKTDLKGYSRT